MKNIKIIVILITTIIFATNCTKQNNCDCGYEGKFVYYKKPLKIGYVHNGNLDIDAQLFVFNAEINSYYIYDIQGYVPYKFRSGDTINVRCCLENINMRRFTFKAPYFLGKIKCIERIE